MQNSRTHTTLTLFLNADSITQIICYTYISITTIQFVRLRDGKLKALIFMIYEINKWFN